MLSSLETLFLKFQSPRSHPGGLWSSQPPKHIILPALRRFEFKGVTEYLEELVNRIPQLNNMKITFFNQIDFNTPRLAQFINCTPTLRVPNEVRVHVVVPEIASIGFRYWASENSFGYLSISISCGEADWQLSSIEQVCNSLHSLSTVENLNLYIKGGPGYPLPAWEDDPIENTLWLQLLLPFTGVKNLSLSVELAPGIAATLKGLVTSRVTEILPSLQNIFVQGLDRSGPLRENIEQFVAARQLSDNPIAIFDWNT